MHCVACVCRVGDPAVSQSDVFYFKTPLPTSFDSFPQRLGVSSEQLAS